MRIISCLLLSFCFLTARSQDGTLDLSFGNAGSSMTQNFADTDDELQMVVQPDGKILQMVTVGPDAATQVVLFRHNANGGLDNSFGTSGKFQSSFSGGHAGSDIVIQPDGKIVVIGYIDSGGAHHPFVFRVNTNGTLDAGFGNGGRTIVPFFATGWSYGITTLLQPDGKIVGGCCVSPAQTADLGLFRLTSAGVLDNSFDGDGKVFSNLLYISPADVSGGLELQNDGKIIVAGQEYLASNTQIAVGRFNPNGSFDTGFGTNGIYYSNDPGGLYATCAAIQSDGKILVGGNTWTSQPSSSDFVVLRLTNSGAIDAGFGTNGKVITDFPGIYDYVYSIEVQNDGNILLGGDMSDGTATKKLALIRYTANGALDPGFGTGGKLSVAASNMNCWGGMFAPQGNKIIVAGMSFPLQPGGPVNPTVFRINNSSGFYNPLCNLPAPSITISGNTLTSSANSGNQWYLNGSPVNGANAQTFNASSSGIYTVTVTSGGCTSPLSSPVSYAVTAIEPFASSSGLLLLPNPVGDELIVKNEGRHQLTVVLFDLSGNRLQKRSENNSSIKIDLSEYPAGSYVVVVSNKGRTVLRRMIVRVR